MAEEEKKEIPGGAAPAQKTEAEKNASPIKPEKEKAGAAGKDAKKPRRPIMPRGERLRRRFHGTSQGPFDPLIDIMERHNLQKHKIVKLGVVIFIIIVIGSFTAFQIQNFKSEREFNEKIANIEGEIKALDAKIAANSSYQKYKAALDATIWIDAAKNLDFRNEAKWNLRRAQYVKIIDGSRPVQGSDYVVPMAVIDMVFIPRGRFEMGRRADEPGGEPDELPRHPVVLDSDFWISRTEVTNAQFREFFPTHRSDIYNGYKLDNSYQPVVDVDWHLASAFCSMLNQRELEAGRIPAGCEYRLPTEAEWEYCCHAGTETYYFFGDDFPSSGGVFANTRDLRTTRQFRWKEDKRMAPSDGHTVSAPVGSYKPNAFGLHDMHGNVWEWCRDWYNPRAYSELPEHNPVQLKPVVSNLEMRGGFDMRYTVEATSRVIRGGSWGNTPEECRSAARDSTVPETKNTGIGFRIVLATIIPPPEPTSK